MRRLIRAVFPEENLNTWSKTAMTPSSLSQWFKQGKSRLMTLVVLAMSLPSLAMAQGLPTMDPPSQGGGGLMSTIQGYIFDFGALIGLVLCTIALLIVGAAAIASFKEARERETWGKFTVTVVVGVALVVVIIWLATEAAPILSQ